MRTTRELGLLTALALTSLLLAAGCGGGSSAPAGDGAAAATAAGVPAAAMAEAQQIFQTRCTACHGANGAGDGPASAALQPKPRNYSSAEWQASTTDEEIEKVILGGGPAVGKSPLMPPNPDLAAKPDVVRGLRVIVRGFAK